MSFEVKLHNQTTQSVQDQSPESKELEPQELQGALEGRLVSVNTIISPEPKIFSDDQKGAIDALSAQIFNKVTSRSLFMPNDDEGVGATDEGTRSTDRQITECRQSSSLEAAKSDSFITSASDQKRSGIFKSLFKTNTRAESKVEKEEVTNKNDEIIHRPKRDSKSQGAPSDRRSERKKKHDKASKIILYSDPDFAQCENRSILIDGDVTYKLCYFKEGDFHKVWEVEGDKKEMRSDILIKTSNGKRNPNDHVKCREGLEVAYSKLVQRKSTQKDIRTAKIEFKNGYIICERLSKHVTIDDWEKGSLDGVRKVFESMLLSSEWFLPDFRPCNVMLDDKDFLVIVDPEQNIYEKGNDDDIETMAIDMVRYLKEWSNGGDAKIFDYLVENFETISKTTDYAKDLWKSIQARRK